MELDPTTVVRDIEALRVGLAARDSALLDRLGVQLRKVCGITDQDSPPQIVAKLGKTIERVLGDHRELRITLLAVLGLHPEARQANPRMRLEWAADKLHIGCLRTAYRRATEAISLFAHQAVATALESSEAIHPGFILKSFWSNTSFTRDRPRFIQRREITVTADVLPVVPCAFAFLDPPAGYEPRFDIKVTLGGTRWYDIRRRGCKVEYWVKPWHLLRRGETYVFEVDYSLPDGLLMAPHSILTPLTGANRLEMLLTFDPTHLPARVWRVNRVTRPEVDLCPSDNADRLDPSGRFHATFSSLQQGWCYGAAWSWR